LWWQYIVHSPHIYESDIVTGRNEKRQLNTNWEIKWKNDAAAGSTKCMYVFCCIRKLRVVLESLASCNWLRTRGRQRDKKKGDGQAQLGIRIYNIPERTHIIVRVSVFAYYLKERKCAFSSSVVAKCCLCLLLSERWRWSYDDDDDDAVMMSTLK